MSYQLKPDEQVIMRIQRYWVSLLPQMIVFTIWFVAPFFFMYPLFRQGQWGVWIFLVLVLSAAFFGLRFWFSWYKTIFVVTNKRLIDIDQKGWFSHMSSSIMFSKIDDVSFSKKGVIRTVFGYGTVKIVTTGTSDDVIVEQVKNPARLNNLINEMLGKRLF
jgi:uncharacterized membrane protein YdbT with pleckstrin-like domain